MRVKKPFRALGRIVFSKAPIEAQLIVTRRCNLSCGYCSEYDHSSAPAPVQALKERIDALHRLQVVHISMLGGEPLLHPQIDEIVAYAASRAQVSITSNGFLLSEEMIERLNQAGLSNMQISIDTFRPEPSGYIQKSLKTILPKLERAKRLANFDLNVNVVLCPGSQDQFVELFRELRDLGVSVTIGLIHNERGKVEIGGAHSLALWDHFYREGSAISFVEYEYGRRLLLGQRPAWKCRAGARYLYVDEFGQAQFCSAQRGKLNKPISSYSRAEIRRQSGRHKGCESGCSIFCVYRASQVDNAPLALVGALVEMVVHGLRWRNGYARHREAVPQPAAPRPARRKEILPDLGQ